MNNNLTVDKWHEWDVVAMRIKLALTRLGYDIPITCAESDYVYEPEKKDRRNKKTICLDTLEVYDSAGLAAKAVGATNGSQIAAVCRGELRNYKDHRFAYYDDYVAGTIPRYKGKQRRGKP